MLPILSYLPSTSVWPANAFSVQTMNWRIDYIFSVLFGVQLSMLLGVTWLVWILYTCDTAEWCTVDQWAWVKTILGLL
jgi:hypothetical protein